MTPNRALSLVLSPQEVNNKKKKRKEKSHREVCFFHLLSSLSLIINKLVENIKYWHLLQNYLLTCFFFVENIYNYLSTSNYTQSEILKHE